MLSLCCNKHKKTSGNLEGNINEAFAHTEANGKLPVHIVVEEPTPPVTRRILENYDQTINRPLSEEFKADIVDLDVKVTPQNIILASYTVETIEQQSVIDENEGGEAKIIDLLDQVLQAEEDTYGEISSINEGKFDDVLVSTAPEPIPHRKSLGELSDADSDASLSNPGLSQYDVVAQVHREDLPKVDEEYNEDENDIQVKLHDAEHVTFFNDSETASRTDESGYSDTTDNNHIHDSIEELKLDIEPYIPPPPPPPPPPFIEHLYTNPPFMKSYSMSPRAKPSPVELEKKIPRESVISNASHDDKTIVFGSARQMTFADKLSGILMKQMPTSEPEGRKRSNSAGNVVEAIDMSKERPSVMLELHKELLAREVAHSLRPIIKAAQENNDVDDNNKSDEDLSMTRQDLKSKLEGIFANGGTQLGKPRLIKIHSQEEDNSSLESAIVKAVTKVEKSDTLKMQKAKFSQVLNAIKLGHNKEDHV